MESISNKGKRCFIHENNKFTSYRKDQQGNEYWRCTINRCTARLKTSTVGEVVELISNHAHADTVQNEAVQMLRTACKRKATDTACERPSKVIRTVLSEQAESDISSSDILNVRAAMYRERRKYQGTLPRNVNETISKTVADIYEQGRRTRKETVCCCCIL